MPPRRLRGPVAPRRSRRAAMERLIADRVAKAIDEHERNRPNSDNAEGSTNVQGCSHKTFMNGKPHSFNGTKGVVGLRRWIEKVEQVFGISKCAEQDKERKRLRDKVCIFLPNLSLNQAHNSSQHHSRQTPNHQFHHSLSPNQHSRPSTAHSSTLSHNT
ncbi:hypothetical protein Tco_0912875 [Tanacetum coccineum]